MWSRSSCCRFLRLNVTARRHMAYIEMPPIDSPTFKERMAMASCTPKPYRPVDIGFKLTADKVKNLPNNGPAPARTGENIVVPLDTIDEECVLSQPSHVQKVARHYGVYETMFGRAEFLPVVPLRVEFAVDQSFFAGEDVEEGLCHVVARGNLIKPAEAGSTPCVSFRIPRSLVSGKASAKWTLTCSSLEGGIRHGERESLLWLVDDIGSDRQHSVTVSSSDDDNDQCVNIPVSDSDGRVINGREIVHYRQPMPLRGTGFHRVAFVLYKHDVSTSSTGNTENWAELDDGGEVAFSSEQFYRQRQHHMTPVSLVFYQTDWDGSVQRKWQQLGLHTGLTGVDGEPVFEYEFRPPYVRRQPWFPAGESVQHFFDKHMQFCDIQKQMLIKRLQRVRPFAGDAPQYRYPVALIPDAKQKWLSTWVRNEMKKEGHGIGKYYFIERRHSQLFNPYC